MARVACVAPSRVTHPNHLHPQDTGYEVMAKSVDLKLLRVGP
jgi:hypothetical protein